ncbi:hypothetical protein [Ruminococcus flavefaciens]|uniref:hypothetical protein n=1 Tax=Ruminococcus flavefaciens TaxID=1265 RepID=UPI0002D9B16C|nr:hypothetical protein [Ruminococcus flavefaciens]
MGIRRIIKGGMAAAVIIAVIFAGIGIMSAVSYTKGVPRIYPKKGAAAAPNSIISCHDIADIEYYETAKISEAFWTDYDKSCLDLSEDGSSLRIGDKKGELNVIVGAEGKKEMSFELIKVTVR